MENVGFFSYLCNYKEQEYNPLRPPAAGLNGTEYMTTSEEFQQAIKLLISCRATLNSGCQFNDLQADWLYYQCKHFIEDYKKRTEK